MASRIKENVIALTRVYDAPLQAVWDAWTQPDEVAQWWGPRGFTLTTHSHDLRTGGHWHYTMHGPDGTDYENTTAYLDVQPMQRMVYDHGGHTDRPPLFRVTAMFTERDGRTQLDMHMAFPTPEVAVQMSGFIRQAGGESTWDRLAEYLGKQHAARELFVISRSFQADIDTLYTMWTEPEHLAQWLPPTGATMRFLRAEPQVGGVSFYEMRFGEGAAMFGRIRYVELLRPSRLVYVQEFCDAQEHRIRPSFFRHWPPAMVSTVELVAEDAAMTRVTVRWEPMDATAEDLAEFVGQRAGMTGGWTGSFEKLEALLQAG